MKKDENENEDKKYSSLQSKESRRLKYQNKKKQSTWFGLGFIGLVGWSIATPTVIGALIGLGLDRKFPQKFSWTLTLMMAGLIIGVFSAWYWVDKENKEIQKEQNDDNE